jgi:hypothetical protein
MHKRAMPGSSRYLRNMSKLARDKRVPASRPGPDEDLPVSREDDPEVEDVFANASSHCTAYQWLYDHHRELRQRFKVLRPNWRKAAESMGQKGLVNGKGEPPTAANLCKYWWLINRRMGNVEEPASAPATQPTAAPAAVRRIFRDLPKAPGEIAPGIERVVPDFKEPPPLDTSNTGSWTAEKTPMPTPNWNRIKQRSK